MFSPFPDFDWCVWVHVFACRYTIGCWAIRNFFTLLSSVASSLGWWNIIVQTHRYTAQLLQSKYINYKKNIVDFLLDLFLHIAFLWCVMLQPNVCSKCCGGGVWWMKVENIWDFITVLLDFGGWRFYWIKNEQKVQQTFFVLLVDDIFHFSLDLWETAKKLVKIEKP